MLTARQGYADDAGVVHKWSATSAQRIVYLLPSPHAAATIVKPIYQCGQAIYVDGQHSGIVHVHSSMLGREIATPTEITRLDGGVEIALTDKLIDGDDIYVVQEAVCGGFSPPSPVAHVSSISSVKLAPPDVLGGLTPTGAYRTLRVSNVIPGATVTLTRNGTPIPFAARAFGMSEGDLAIPPDFALHLGDIIRATQTLCELTSAPSGTRVEVFAT